ncbi:hypothetical protein [Haloferax sp. YSMS24]|uniref:hypothetical protein n=1 Tax=unclassified Haloferax TaxID=2625095 RepID=UPI00398CEC9A
MIPELRVHDMDWDDETSEIIARVTLVGEVTGDSPTARFIEDRYPRLLARFRDEREVLAFLSASHSNGYKLTSYDSPASKEVVESLSDEEYLEWCEEHGVKTLFAARRR